MANLVQWVDHHTLLNEAFSTGFISAVSSAIFNNHPTSGIMIYVIDQLARPELQEKIMVFSALIGGDLGPKMLPIGSLAALMWFKILRDRKIEVSYVTYIKLGIPITLTSVAVALAVLHAELYIYTAFNP
jgi:arsenical pump membrane protein